MDDVDAVDRAVGEHLDDEGVAELVEESAFRSVGVACWSLVENTRTVAGRRTRASPL